MITYLLILVMAIGLPVLYFAALKFYMPDFEEEKNQKRKLFHSIPEIVVMLISEITIFKIWYDYKQESLQGVMLALLYISLVVMTVLCMTDYWERIVPNKILGIYILVGILVSGIQGVLNMNDLLGLMPSMILGLVFCAISFGVCYLVSRGSLGSGDVKLALLLGVFMTGDYVVGTVFYGCLCSAAYSLIQLCRKRLSRKDEIPFVPFLYMGMIIIYLVG